MFGIWRKFSNWGFFCFSFSLGKVICWVGRQRGCCTRWDYEIVGVISCVVEDSFPVLPTFCLVGWGPSAQCKLSQTGWDRVFKERILVTLSQQSFGRHHFNYKILKSKMCNTLIKFPGSIRKNPVFTEEKRWGQRKWTSFLLPPCSLKQLSFFIVFYFYTIFKGYFQFTVITKYCLYSLCCTIHP